MTWGLGLSRGRGEGTLCNRSPCPQDHCGTVVGGWVDGALLCHLLVKRQGHNATITAPEEFTGRLSIGEDNSLLIANGVLSDQRTFTCMIVMASDITELAVEVFIHSE